MTEHREEATYHNPPKKLDAETLARAQIAAEGFRWEAMSANAKASMVFYAETLLASPEWQAHNAAVWNEGWRQAACHAPDLDANPYEVQP